MLTADNTDNQSVPPEGAQPSQPTTPQHQTPDAQKSDSLPVSAEVDTDTDDAPKGRGRGKGNGGGKRGLNNTRNRKNLNEADGIARAINMPERDPDGNLLNSLGGLGAQRDPADAATLKPRHRNTLIGFIAFVLLPLFVISIYLFGFAQNQYASEAGFSVRKEEGPTSVDAIGGLAQLTGAASPDAEILYDFIKSQELVDQIDKDLGLEKIFGRSYRRDPFYSLASNSTIEDKVDYWASMVRVEYNESSGLIRLQVRAFTPEEAQEVARAVMANSSAMINQLSIAAREDGTRYARDDFAKAVERVKVVREAITEFRMRTQVVDPAADIQSQMGLMSTLEGQLAASLIDLDMLQDVAKTSDPRVEQAERRIDVINRRLAAERKKFGIGGSGGPDGRNYAAIVAEYERLVVDRSVAEEAFKSATLLLDTALAEAQRKSRYLAAHVEPTLAQSALYPRTSLILLVSAFLLTMLWAMATLIYYSIRDRR